MILIKIRLAFFISLLLNTIKLFSQDIDVKISPEKLSIGNTLQITLTIKNEQIKNYGQFPQIKGFRKSGISSSSSTNFINGKRTSSQSIIQNYTATETGAFFIDPFTIEVNGKKIRANGRKIEVDDSYNEPKQSPFNNFFDPFDDPFDNFFDRNNDEYYEVEADAFLSLNTDKKNVYVGEGFNAVLSFYVSENNVADMRFYELGKQLTEIIKKIKPPNCWEENFNVENINSVPVVINNKRYNQYKIFEATYYPLNNETIQFPKLGLELIKYKISKRPSFFGRNKVEDYEKFYSKPLNVSVKNLPPHPLKENISVGNFILKEKVNSNTIDTGDNFTYEFEIVGEGNISAISEPNININEIDFYPPNTQQTITRERSKVYGSKKFNYYAVPNEPGEYDLSKNIEWIYFDPKENKYDTLRTGLNLLVTGESQKNNFIKPKDTNPILESINKESNKLISNKNQLNINVILNIITLTLIIVFSLFLLRKKYE